MSVSCDSAMHAISKACNELNIPGIKEINAITSQNKYILMYFLTFLDVSCKF